jgi:hypothetical protein
MLCVINPEKIENLTFTASEKEWRVFLSKSCVASSASAFLEVLCIGVSHEYTVYKVKQRGYIHEYIPNFYLGQVKFTQLERSDVISTINFRQQ